MMNYDTRPITYLDVKEPIDGTTHLDPLGVFRRSGLTPPQLNTPAPKTRPTRSRSPRMAELVGVVAEPAGHGQPVQPANPPWGISTKDEPEAEVTGGGSASDGHIEPTAEAHAEADDDDEDDDEGATRDSTRGCDRRRSPTP